MVGWFDEGGQPCLETTTGRYLPREKYWVLFSNVDVAINEQENKAVWKSATGHSFGVAKC